MKICSLCGNPVEEGLSVCPYCQTNQTGSGRIPKPVQTKTINLELGMPTVLEAMAILERELNFARSSGVKVIRIIHGYGSSGIGGQIRLASRKFLNHKMNEGKIRRIIPGEDYTKSNGVYEELIDKYPFLKQKEKTDIKNPGITLIEL